MLGKFLLTLSIFDYDQSLNNNWNKEITDKSLKRLIKYRVNKLLIKMKSDNWLRINSKSK